METMRARGFTLVEMLVVMALLGILAMAATPLVELTTKRNKERELKAALWEIRRAIDAYKDAYDRGLIVKTGPASGYPASLTVLTLGLQQTGPHSESPLYLLRRIPRDPFNPSSMPPEMSWNLRSYASTPERPEPGEDIYDIHSASQQVGMNGVPYSRW